MANATMTELEAINYMITVAGLQPVSTLEVEGIPELTIAKATLTAVSREVQSEGWNFNSEYSYTLTPEAENNYILVPLNAISIDPSDDYYNYVVRGGKLYDKMNQQYTFDSTVDVDVIWYFDFDELPQVARDYIMIRATRVFQSKILADPTIYQFNMVDENQARARLLAADVDSGDYNMLTSSSDTRNMLRRF